MAMKSSDGIPSHPRAWLMRTAFLKRRLSELATTAGQG
jgi:hypothetical protein